MEAFRELAAALGLFILRSVGAAGGLYAAAFVFTGMPLSVGVAITLLVAGAIATIGSTTAVWSGRRVQNIRSA